MNSENYSVTRGISFELDTSGKATASLNIPFPVKEIRVISSVFDDSTIAGGNAQYMIFWSDLMPNTPIAITGGVYQPTINGNYGNTFKFKNPTQLSGTINIWSTDIILNSMTLADITFLFLVLEFVQA